MTLSPCDPGQLTNHSGTPSPTCLASRTAVVSCVEALTSSGLQLHFQFFQMFQKSVTASLFEML